MTQVIFSRDLYGPSRGLSQALRRTKSRQGSKMFSLGLKETMAARSAKRYPLCTSCASNTCKLMLNTVWRSTASLSSLLSDLLHNALANLRCLPRFHRSLLHSSKGSATPLRRTHQTTKHQRPARHPCWGQEMPSPLPPIAPTPPTHAQRPS